MDNHPVYPPTSPTTTSSENPTFIKVKVAPPEQATTASKSSTSTSTSTSTNMEQPSTATATESAVAAADATSYCVVDYLYPDETTSTHNSHTHANANKQSSKHPRRNSLSKIVRKVMMGRRNSTGGSASNTTSTTSSTTTKTNMNATGASASSTTVHANHSNSDSYSYSQNGSEASHHDNHHHDSATLYHDTAIAATTAGQENSSSNSTSPTTPTAKSRTSKLHRFGRKHKHKDKDDDKKVGRSKSMTDAIPTSKSKNKSKNTSDSVREPTIYYTRTSSGRGSVLMGNMDHLVGGQPGATANTEENTDADADEATATAMELDESNQSHNDNGSQEDISSNNNYEKSSPQKLDTSMSDNHDNLSTNATIPCPPEQATQAILQKSPPPQKKTVRSSLVVSPRKSNTNTNTNTNPQQPQQQPQRRRTIMDPSNMHKTFVMAPVQGMTSLVQKAGSTVATGGNLIVKGTTSTVQKSGKAVMDGGKFFVEQTTNTVVYGGKAVMDGGKTIVGGGKAIVDSTTSVVGMGGKAVMDGGKLFVEGTTSTVQKGGKAVMDGGKLIVENTVVLGGKTIVGGGKAIVDGTTSVVGYGGKTVVKGAKGVVKGLKKASNIRSFHFHKKQMSKWEEGLEVIDELLLDPDCAAYHALTPEQRKKLQSVKKILLKGPSGDNKTQHVPRELLHNAAADLEYERMDGNHFMGVETVNKNGTGMESRKSSIRGSIAMRRNSNFILQEYAGVKNTSSLLNDMSDADSMYGRRRADVDDNNNDDDAHLRVGNGNDSTAASTTKSTSDSGNPTNVPGVQSPSFENNAADAAAAAAAVSDKEMATSSSKCFCPPEFLALSTDDKQQVMKMLSWDSISEWNYDIFRLAELTKGHPLLFMGYAILGAPYSQQAMAAELGILHTDGDNSGPQQGYNFRNELTIPPDKLCNYIRTMESDYSAENPYHNSTHAADVLQSLHTLIQVSKDVDFIKGCPPLYLLTILLAAIVHDVSHPGKTNAFHIQLKSELAVMYNDRSVLENWHVAHAFSRMLNVDLGGLSSEQVKHQVLNATMYHHHNNDSPNNILCHATQDQFNTIRKHMIEAVLHTDMTSHFESVNSARGMLLEDEEESGGLKKEERTWRLLMYMLHLADISGQAKDGNLFIEWTHRCMDEFFKQGDEELKLGLPVSPNCDRNTTVPSVAQMGFIEFVVEPAYQVLGNYIPFVQDNVVSIIQKNLEYWMDQDEDADDGPLLPVLRESSNFSGDC